MELTGLPLIGLSLLATAAAGAGTVVRWNRFGRGRLIGRAAGVLVCEALLVVTAGLIANRHDQFYPSWAALAGDTGASSATATRAAGSLDGSFGADRLTMPWLPPDAAGWHLGAPPEISVPPGYVGARGEFPALVALGGRATGGDLVRVGAAPTGRTTAAALADLPARLGTDLRVTGHGWALLASARDALLAGALIRRDPGRFAALAVVGTPPATFRRPDGVAVAVARTTAGHGRLPAGAAALTGSWAAATRWALGHTAAPLAPPEVLPPAVVR
jgi:hypothetical protein